MLKKAVVYGLALSLFAVACGKKKDEPGLPNRTQNSNRPAAPATAFTKFGLGTWDMLTCETSSQGYRYKVRITVNDTKMRFHHAWFKDERCTQPDGETVGLEYSYRIGAINADGNYEIDYTSASGVTTYETIFVSGDAAGQMLAVPNFSGPYADGKDGSTTAKRKTAVNYSMDYYKN